MTSPGVSLDSAISKLNHHIETARSTASQLTRDTNTASEAAEPAEATDAAAVEENNPGGSIDVTV